MGSWADNFAQGLVRGYQPVAGRRHERRMAQEAQEKQAALELMREEAAKSEAQAQREWLAEQAAAQQDWLREKSQSDYNRQLDLLREEYGLRGRLEGATQRRQPLSKEEQEIFMTGVQTSLGTLDNLSKTAPKNEAERKETLQKLAEQRIDLLGQLQNTVLVSDPNVRAQMASQVKTSLEAINAKERELIMPITRKPLLEPTSRAAAIVGGTGKLLKAIPAYQLYKKAVPWLFNPREGEQ